MRRQSRPLRPSPSPTAALRPICRLGKGIPAPNCLLMSGLGADKVSDKGTRASPATRGCGTPGGCKPLWFALRFLGGLPW